MAKLKTRFDAENNSAYPNQSISVNIIGSKPEHEPYLSITVMENRSQIANGWLSDNDLERFAVNILKALKSKKLKSTKQ